MITKDAVEECIKNKIISASLDCIQEVLDKRGILPPEEGNTEYGNPRESLMSTIEAYLDFLYQDAQRVALIDLSCLPLGKREE